LSRFSPADIRGYYDRNTPGFVARGQGGSVGAIHRAIWAPGVRSSDEAFRYIENQIIDCVRRLPHEVARPHIVDLGCGVGASLCYLAGQLPGMRGTGITLSPVQAQSARERIESERLAGRVECLEGDYGDLPASVAPADLAYAIESFVHGPDPARFFAECGRLIRDGGLLVICDDFKRPATDPAAVDAVEQFRRGWHINTLIDRTELRRLARGAGFEHDTTVDLTQYLQLNRPRDRAISVLIGLVGWIPMASARFDHLAGGTALQRCLERGWIGYDLVVFRRVAR
jgi:tocopherol O-methyltransferase